MDRKLFIGNLSFKIKEDDLEDMFSEFGDIEEVVLVKDRNTNRSKGFGFVTFFDEKSADLAISGMNKKEIEGRELTVNVSEEKERSHGRHSRFERPEEPEDEIAEYCSTAF